MTNAEFTSSIQLTTFAKGSGRHVVMRESLDGRYMLSVPIGRGNVKIDCGRGTIFDGDVRPGLLRILAPGERVRVTRRSPSSVAILSVSGPEFRNIVAEQGYKCQSSRFSQFEPVVKPTCAAERLSLSLLATSELDTNQRELFIVGVTLSLLSILFSPRDGDARAGHAPGKGELTDAQLARCLDYADSRVAERLDVMHGRPWWACRPASSHGAFSAKPGSPLTPGS